MKTKVETRGRRTNLEVVEDALGTGATIPPGALPIPMSVKALVSGKDAMTILREAAPYCAHYLYNCIIGRKFKPAWARIDVAKYVLDQVCGKARVRLEVSGADGTPLNWQSVMLLFAQADKAEELSRHGKPLPLPPQRPRVSKPG